MWIAPARPNEDWLVVGRSGGDCGLGVHISRDQEVAGSIPTGVSAFQLTPMSESESPTMAVPLLGILPFRPDLALFS